VNRFFYLIWLIGAGVWFFDAVLSMHWHFLARGLAQAALAAGFLATGMLFRQHYRRQQQRRQRQNSSEGDRKN
jgi:Flp pilus assembly protein TadB